VREIRTLRSTWRELETGLRTRLIGARHARKGGYRGRLGLPDTAPAPDPTAAVGSGSAAAGGATPAGPPEVSPLARVARQRRACGAHDSPTSGPSPGLGRPTGTSGEPKEARRDRFFRMAIGCRRCAGTLSGGTISCSHERRVSLVHSALPKDVFSTKSGHFPDVIIILRSHTHLWRLPSLLHCPVDLPILIESNARVRWRDQSGTAR
jgi:hypothetical protein